MEKCLNILRFAEKSGQLELSVFLKLGEVSYSMVLLG